MFGYVYITENLINNKKYIGKKRSSIFVSNYKGSGKIIKSAFCKYGFDNFKVTVIEECDTQDELNSREIYWISYYNADKDPNFYNISKGGDGGDNFSGLTDNEKTEIRNKISKAMSGNKNPMYGVSLSRDKNGMYGKKHSSETRKSISDNKSGSNHQLYGKYREDCYNFGRIGINNGIINRKVRSDKLDEYIRDGYALGLIVNNPAKKSQEWKDKISNRISMNNGISEVRVTEDKMDEFSKQGYVVGRIRRKKVREDAKRDIRI